jgi:hypothetical protein
MDNIVYDGSTHCRHGDLHEALVRSGGTTRDYRQVLHLNNDVRNNTESEVTQHVKVQRGDSYIETDSATISFWIRPTGISKDTTGIVFNNAEEGGFSHGVVLSVNGNAYSLGYNWKNQKTSHNVDLGVILEHDTWSFVVVIIYSTGIVRVFLNNVYVKYYDLGVKHEVATFDNLEIGRFSGMIDDVKFYSDTLYYGKVLYGHPAQSYVRALYESSRIPDASSTKETETTSTETSELNFYYMQNIEFIDAHMAYTDLGGMSGDGGTGETPEDHRKQQFVLDMGGVNDLPPTHLAYAVDDFTAIAGNITNRFVEL